MRRLWFVVFLFPLLFNNVGCSGILESNPILDETLVSIANRYLTEISIGRGREAASMILWADYTANTRNGLTPDQYVSKVDKFRERKQTDSDNPLRGLDVNDVDSDENTGSVTLKHPKNGDKIQIEMLWTGSGWLIVRDNLFGADGYLASNT